MKPLLEIIKDHYIKRIGRLVPLKGPISNEDAFNILRRHFVDGVSKKTLADEYDHVVGRSFILRILSTKEGTDTSRLPMVRKIFGEYMEKIGMQNPFHKYYSAKQKKRIQDMIDNGLGILK